MSDARPGAARPGDARPGDARPGDARPGAAPVGVTRRGALVTLAAGAAALALGAPALVGLTRKRGPRPLVGALADDGHGAGHALRARAAPPPVRRVERRAIVVVGGGAAGLSAAWWLLRHGVRDFVLLELGREAGGNARAGAGAAGAYPWGAHYLPVPGPRATLVRTLCREMGLLAADGTWSERALCHAPKERVFVHGRWHEGLEEAIARSPEDAAELRRLAEEVAALRATGAFTIPLALGAPADHPLDALTATAWLAREGYRSPAVRWLVDYACRDDFGTGARDTSAWAALHYFAAREADHDGADAGPLTWPEGNAHLVRWLAARAAGHVVTGAPVRRVERRPALPVDRQLRVLAGDVAWECGAVVWAAPTFLARHVVEGAPAVPWRHAPWLVANLTLDRRPDADPERDAPEAWDNVLLDSPALGYVVATHQQLRAAPEPATVWTWYHALAAGDPADVRRRLLAMDWRAGAELALADLERAHPTLRDCVARVDVMRYGHAMPRPEPGFLARHRPWWDAGALGGRVRWANADVSGISVFEEAQWRGVRAAEGAMRLLG